MKLVSAVLLLLLGVGCPAAYSYAKSAPPIEKTVAFIESSPKVIAAIGEKPSVSLTIAREFKRDMVKHDGRDRVELDTKVTGSKGEARLVVDALNVREQGWAGRFALTTEGTPTLVDGQYVTKGGGTILEGTFAPDGAPLVK